MTSKTALWRAEIDREIFPLSWIVLVSSVAKQLHRLASLHIRVAAICAAKKKPYKTTVVSARFVVPGIDSDCPFIRLEHEPTKSQATSIYQGESI